LLIIESQEVSVGYIASLLSRNEQIVFGTRRHWVVLASSFLVNGLISLAIIALGLALTLVLGPLAWLGLLLLALPLVRFAVVFLNWWNEQYIVTNRRVIQTEGVINKHVIDSSLEKVNDVVLEQSALGRIFDYGTVEILTASEIGVNRFEQIARPVLFKTEMLNAKEALGALDSFEGQAKRVLAAPTPASGDIPELIAELDELRRKGIISEAEFQQKKNELLAGL
jgi:uncharacterized membrane protein YdbT with pleckstrin-like domain